MKEIEICSKRIKKANGEEFTAYRGYTKKGWLDLRFTKKCQEGLTEDLKQKLEFTKNFKLTVKEDDMNISKKERFDVIYIQAFDKFEEIKFEKHLEDYFD